MRTKLLLLYLTFAISIYSFGQEISKNEILKFKIKSIKTIDEDGTITNINFYNQHGNIFKQSSPNADHKIIINKEFIYDDNDKLIQERTFDFKGDNNLEINHIYNNVNQLIKSELIQNNEIGTTWLFEYDKNRNKIKETQTSKTMGNSTTKYTYDLNQLLIQEDKSNTTIGKEERVTYQYNSVKLLIEKKTISYYFNTTIKVTYFYNDKNKLIKLVEDSSNGVSSMKTFEYNTDNLLIRDNWKGSISKIIHKTTYEIGYN